MNYKEKFEKGFIPIINNEKIKWYNGISTRITLQSLPYEKVLNYFKWKINQESSPITDCKIFSLECSNYGYSELFVFKEIIYENYHSYPEDWNSHYFLEYYQEILKLADKSKINKFYCGEMKNKEGLWKVYNKTFEWFDGEIWNTNIEHYRYLCKIKDTKTKEKL